MGTSMGQTTAKLEFVMSRGTDHELRVTLTDLVVDTNAYCALLGTKFITATNGAYNSYTKKFKYRYRAIDGILHSYELPAPCESVTTPLVAYAFLVGLIYSSSELLDVLGTSKDDVLSYKDEEMLAPGHIFGAQFSHMSTICAAMEAEELQELTALGDSHRQDDAMLRMKAPSMEVIQPAYPTSQWMGEIVYGAQPINYSIRNISPLSLQRGVHVMENFAGVGLGVLRMTVAAGIVIFVYTYVDRDSIIRKIARHAPIQLQLQPPHINLHSAIKSFDRMFMCEDISLIGPAVLTNLVAHYGPVDILGGSWECPSVCNIWLP